MHVVSVIPIAIINFNLRRFSAGRLAAIVCLACLFLLALSPKPVGAAPQEAAIVVAERGEVQFQRLGNRPVPLGLQGALRPGDRVTTGPHGEVALLFSDGSRIKLNANSSVRITVSVHARSKENLFQALFGVIWAHLRPGQRIQAPTANIVVRGTEVLLSIGADGTTTLTVTEGEASFFNSLGSVEVGSAQQSVARPGQAPTPPVTVDVSGLIAWTADVVGLPLEFEFPSPTQAAVAPPEYAAEASRLGLLVQRNPTDAVAWANLGYARRGLGDLPGALAAFAQADQLSPSNAEARVGMALIYLSQNQADQARAILEPVREQAAPLVVLGLADLHEGKGIDAERNLQGALAQNPSLPSARALLALAYLTQNALPDADATAREAVRRQPQSAQAQGTLAMVLFFEGQTRAAEAASRLAVHLNPRSPFALLAEGRSLLAKQQTDAARADYEKAAFLAPNLWLVHQELGTVYLRLDMPKKAGDEYQIALRLNPGSSDAHTGQGLVFQRQGRFADAEREHRQALLLAPANVTAHYNLATLFIDRGRLGEAQQELESGVQAAPERGILYARLAELSLYRQDLFAAQEFARRAVRLLPDSAVAHYELGRVYLEQERTVQAEQEFRQATTLDRQFAAARYALGLTREKTEAGLLSSFSSLLGSALVGSPGSTLSLENLQTPGAEQRIQAALLDPTVVRTASRSYGNTQLDVQYGEQGIHDLAGSFLTSTSNGRGIRGFTGEDQATNGVRANADNKHSSASIVFGQKASDSSSGIFILGEYEETDSGLDTATASDSYEALQRFHSRLPRLIAGVNLQTGPHSRLRALVQGSKPENSVNNREDSNDHTEFDISSLNSELRWDLGVGESNLISAGISYGSRRLRAVTTYPGEDAAHPPNHEVDVARAQPLQIYLRDELQANNRVLLTGEMQILRLNTFRSFEVLDQTDNPATHTSRQTTVGLPNIIVAYKLDAQSALRIRARRTFATVKDFELLTPTDVFLLSYTGLPQTRNVLSPAHGTNLEFEYDRTFANAAFLRLGAFQQDLKGADFAEASVGKFKWARVRGLRASYEGLLLQDLSFFVNANVNDARDMRNSRRIPQVPNFTGLASVQYLNRAGYYGQVAGCYQTNRLLETNDAAQLGAFSVFNLRIGKRNGLQTNVFAEVDNIFNKRYDVFGELQPGRVFRIGISKRF